MSIKNVEKFFDLIKSDENIAKELIKINNKIQQKDSVFDEEQFIKSKVVPIAKENGINFTAKEFLEYAENQISELSDEELLNISGGASRQSVAWGFLLATLGSFLNVAAINSYPLVTPIVMESDQEEKNNSHKKSASNLQENNADSKEETSNKKHNKQKNIKKSTTNTNRLGKEKSKNTSKETDRVNTFALQNRESANFVEDEIRNEKEDKTANATNESIRQNLAVQPQDQPMQQPDQPVQPQDLDEKQQDLPEEQQNQRDDANSQNQDEATNPSSQENNDVPSLQASEQLNQGNEVNSQDQAEQLTNQDEEQQIQPEEQPNQNEQPQGLPDQPTNLDEKQQDLPEEQLNQGDDVNSQDQTEQLTNLDEEQPDQPEEQLNQGDDANSQNQDEGTKNQDQDGDPNPQNQDEATNPSSQENNDVPSLQASEQLKQGDDATYQSQAERPQNLDEEQLNQDEQIIDNYNNSSPRWRNILKYGALAAGTLAAAGYYVYTGELPLFAQAAIALLSTSLGTGGSPNNFDINKSNQNINFANTTNAHSALSPIYYSHLNQLPQDALPPIQKLGYDSFDGNTTITPSLWVADENLPFYNGETLLPQNLIFSPGEWHNPSQDDLDLGSSQLENLNSAVIEGGAPWSGEHFIRRVPVDGNEIQLQENASQIQTPVVGTDSAATQFVGQQGSNIPRGKRPVINIESSNVPDAAAMQLQNGTNIEITPNTYNPHANVSGTMKAGAPQTNTSNTSSTEVNFPNSGTSSADVSKDDADITTFSPDEDKSTNKEASSWSPLAIAGTIAGGVASLAAGLYNWLRPAKQQTDQQYSGCFTVFDKGYNIFIDASEKIDIDKASKKTQQKLKENFITSFLESNDKNANAKDLQTVIVSSNGSPKNRDAAIKNAAENSKLINRATTCVDVPIIVSQKNKDRKVESATMNVYVDNYVCTMSWDATQPDNVTFSKPDGCPNISTQNFEAAKQLLLKNTRDLNAQTASRQEKLNQLIANLRSHSLENLPPEVQSELGTFSLSAKIDYNADQMVFTFGSNARLDGTTITKDCTKTNKALTDAQVFQKFVKAKCPFEFQSRENEADEPVNEYNDVMNEAAILSMLFGGSTENTDLFNRIQAIRQSDEFNGYKPWLQKEIDNFLSAAQPIIFVTQAPAEQPAENNQTPVELQDKNDQQNENAKEQTVNTGQLPVTQENPQSAQTPKNNGQQLTDLEKKIQQDTLAAQKRAKKKKQHKQNQEENGNGSGRNRKRNKTDSSASSNEKSQNTSITPDENQVENSQNKIQVTPEAPVELHPENIELAVENNAQTDENIMLHPQTPAVQQNQTPAVQQQNNNEQPTKEETKNGNATEQTENNEEETQNVNIVQQDQAPAAKDDNQLFKNLQIKRANSLNNLYENRTQNENIFSEVDIPDIPSDAVRIESETSSDISDQVKLTREFLEKLTQERNQENNKQSGKFSDSESDFSDGKGLPSKSDSKPQGLQPPINISDDNDGLADDEGENDNLNEDNQNENQQQNKTHAVQPAVTPAETQNKTVPQNNEVDQNSDENQVELPENENVLAKGFCGDPFANDGKDVKWALYKNGSLEISGQGAMANNKFNSFYPWNTHKNAIQSINITEGVTSIGESAFSQCEKLTDVTIPDSVTSIGQNAFAGCSSLKQIKIPANVKSIEEGAFSRCASLNTVEIPETVTSIGKNAFAYCTNLEQINIPNNVKSIEENTFLGCTSLTNVAIPKSVTFIGRAAFCSSGLTSITLVEGLTAILSRAFAYCTNLKELIIPASVTFIGEMAFADCSSLESFIYRGTKPPCPGKTYLFASYDTSIIKYPTLYVPENYESEYFGEQSINKQVSSINYKSPPPGIKLGFISPVKNVETPQKVAQNNTPEGKPPNGTFSTPKASKTGEPPVTPLVSNSGQNQQGETPKNSQNSTADIKPASNSNENQQQPVNQENQQPAENTVQQDQTPAEPQPETEHPAVTQENQQQNEEAQNETNSGKEPQSKNEEFDIPSDDGYEEDAEEVDNLGSFSPTDIYDYFGTLTDAMGAYKDNELFKNLKNKLTTGAHTDDEILENNRNNKNNKQIKRSKSLNNLYENRTQNEDPANENILVEGFCGDTSVNNGQNVKWVLYKDGNLEISGAGNMANYDYKGEDIAPAPWQPKYSGEIKTVNIKEGVTSIGSAAFMDCFNIESVKIPETVTSIGEDVFWNCESLKQINIPKNLKSIEKFTFFSCTKLQQINIPVNVTFIGENAFGFCSSLQQIEIPNSVTSIGDSAFENCSNLTNVKINYGTISIGEKAFADCSSLQQIEIPNSVTSIGDSAFENCTGLLSIKLADGLETIGALAFCNCLSLKELVIPASVKSIGGFAFICCSSLESITYHGLKNPAKSYTFSSMGNSKIAEVPSIYVPNEYKSSRFGEISFELSDHTFLKFRCQAKPRSGFKSPLMNRPKEGAQNNSQEREAPNGTFGTPIANKTDRPPATPLVSNSGQNQQGEPPKNSQGSTADIKPASNSNENQQYLGTEQSISPTPENSTNQDSKNGVNEVSENNKPLGPNFTQKFSEEKPESSSKKPTRLRPFIAQLVEENSDWLGDASEQQEPLSLKQIIAQLGEENSDRVDTTEQ